MWLCGCGTFADRICGPADGYTYYRGVRLDVAAVKEGGANVLMAADIPFSAIVDTVLVPFQAHEKRSNRGRSPSSAESAPEK